MPTGKKTQPPVLAVRDGRFGRPHRISNRDRDALAKSILAAGAEEDLIYELVNAINREEYALGKALDELQGRIAHVRTALQLGRGLNDLGEFQGHTYEIDVAICKRELAYRTLAMVFPDEVIRKLRLGQSLTGTDPGAEGRP